MDLEYFKNQINEELDGALQYIKYALEVKSMNQQWSKMFMDMSQAEVSHATNLFKMFDEYYRALTLSYREVPKYLKDLQEEIVDNYTEKAAHVKYVQGMYN